MRKTVLLAVPLMLAVMPVQAQEVELGSQATIAKKEVKSVALTGANEINFGTVTIEEGPEALVLTVEVDGLSEGWHGFHIHEKGDCTAEDFTSAEGHAAMEGQAHGVLDETEEHYGDLANIWVNPTGSGKAQYLVATNIIDWLKDDDGSAFIVHAGPDDYKSDPAGDSGDRVACGVIYPASNP